VWVITKRTSQFPLTTSFYENFIAPRLLALMFMYHPFLICTRLKACVLYYQGNWLGGRIRSGWHWMIARTHIFATSWKKRKKNPIIISGRVFQWKNRETSWKNNIYINQFSLYLCLCIGSSNFLLSFRFRRCEWVLYCVS